MHSPHTRYILLVRKLTFQKDNNEDWEDLKYKLLLALIRIPESIIGVLVVVVVVVGLRVVVGLVLGVNVRFVVGLRVDVVIVPSKRQI